MCISISMARKRKTMRLSRHLSDLVKYTKAVRVHNIETQGNLHLESKSLFWYVECILQDTFILCHDCHIARLKELSQVENICYF